MCREGFRRAMSEQYVALVFAIFPITATLTRLVVLLRTGQKNLVAIERLWEITKETGRPVVDWREALQREGLSVMFY